MPINFKDFEGNYQCTNAEPYLDRSLVKIFKNKFEATYPINVGRNLARQAALTHFVLASDIELYPSLGLAEQFLAMVKEDPKLYLKGKRSVERKLIIMKI